MLVKSTARRIGPSGAVHTAEQGFRTEVSHDFDGFLAAHALLGKYAPAPIFNLHLSDVSKHDGFWIRAIDSQDRLVGLQAVRCLHMGQGALSSYLEDHFDLFRPGDLESEPSQLDLKLDLADPRPGPTLCYQGELWLAPSHRGQGLAQAFVAEGLYEAAARWDPDLVFGLLLPITSNRKYVKAIGYTDLTEGALVWRDRAGNTLRKEGFAWCDREAILSAVASRELRSIMSASPEQARRSTKVA